MSNIYDWLKLLVSQEASLATDIYKHVHTTCGRSGASRQQALWFSLGEQLQWCGPVATPPSTVVAEL